MNVIQEQSLFLNLFFIRNGGAEALRQQNFARFSSLSGCKK